MVNETTGAMENYPEIMTVKEVARYFRVSSKTIYEAVRKGMLRSFQVGRLYRFHRKDVLRWMRGK